jgi:hypothetical protein
MRKFIFGAVVVAALPGAASAQQPDCGQAKSCSVPCTEPCRTTPPPTPPPVAPAGNPGAFAAGPRTGTAVGATRSVGIQGFGLDLPAQRLRMPTLQLPGLVRYARQPHFEADAQNIGFVRNVATEYTYPAGNDGGQNAGIAGGPSVTPAGSCNDGTPAGTAAGCTNGQGAAAGGQYDVYGTGGQMPPLPRVERAVERDVPHPDVGRVQQPGQEQIVRDPATGKLYKVVMHEVPQPQPAVSQRELQLAQELNEQKRRADEVQAKLSRLETLIERIAENQSPVQPGATTATADSMRPLPTTTAVTESRDLFGPPPMIFNEAGPSDQVVEDVKPVERYDAVKTSYQAPPSAVVTPEATSESNAPAHHSVSQPVVEVRPAGDSRLGNTLKRWFAFRTPE